MQSPVLLAQGDPQDAKGMLAQFPGPLCHPNLVRAGHRHSRHARDGLVKLEQRVSGGDVGVIEGQQPGADDGGLLIDAETLDAEVADLLACVLPVAHHECLDVVRLTVGRAGCGEFPDDVLSRIKVLEPLISSDSALGCLPGSGDRRVLQHRVNSLVTDWMLPDPALERPHGRPDRGRSRCHGWSIPYSESRIGATPVLRTPGEYATVEYAIMPVREPPLDEQDSPRSAHGLG